MSGPTLRLILWCAVGFFLGRVIGVVIGVLAGTYHAL